MCRIDELTALAWSVPTYTLCAEFGLKDRSLTKRLNALGIPSPGVHWAKLKAGKNVRYPHIEQTDLARQITMAVPVSFDFAKYEGTLEYQEVLQRVRAPAQAITRRCFHELVWHVPRKELCEVLALNSGELTELCEQFAVPAPSGMDWRMAREGHRITMVPLSSEDNAIVIYLPAQVDMSAMLQRRTPWAEQPVTYPPVEHVPPQLEALVEQWVAWGGRHHASREGLIEGFRLFEVIHAGGDGLNAFLDSLPPRNTLLRHIAGRGGYTHVEVRPVLTALESFAKFRTTTGVREAVGRLPGGAIQGEQAELPGASDSRELKGRFESEYSAPAVEVPFQPRTQTPISEHVSPLGESALEMLATLPGIRAELARPAIAEGAAPAEPEPEVSRLPANSLGGEMDDGDEILEAPETAEHKERSSVGDAPGRPVQGRPAKAPRSPEDRLIEGRVSTRAEQLIVWMTAAPDPGWPHLRDLAVILVMKDCRISIAQAVSIRRDGLTLFRARVKCAGRLGSIQDVALTDRTILALVAYGRAIPGELDDRGALFLNTGGQAYNDQAFRRNLAGYAKQAGIPDFHIKELSDRQVVDAEPA